MSGVVYLYVADELVKCQVSGDDFKELLRLQRARRDPDEHHIIHDMYERSKEVMRLKRAGDIVTSGRYTVVQDE